MNKHVIRDILNKKKKYIYQEEELVDILTEKLNNNNFKKFIF